MNKNELYYENARTGEITNDAFQADCWFDTGADVIFWRWSDVCEDWLDLMVKVH